MDTWIQLLEEKRRLIRWSIHSWERQRIIRFWSERLELERLRLLRVLCRELWWKKYLKNSSIRRFSSLIWERLLLGQSIEGNLNQEWSQSLRKQQIRPIISFSLLMSCILLLELEDRIKTMPLRCSNHSSQEGKSNLSVRLLLMNIRNTLKKMLRSREDFKKL